MGFCSSDSAVDHRDRAIGVFHVLRMEGRGAAFVSLLSDPDLGHVLTLCALQDSKYAFALLTTRLPY